MEMPLLLAGPILRRTESHRVCLWFASSREVNAQAKIYSATVESASAAEDNAGAEKNLKIIGSSEPEGGRPETVRLGDQLYVTLLAVRPLEGAFPTDTLLFYDLFLDGKPLSEIGLIGNERGIAYRGMPLPCFFIPERITNFFHCSCRKPHGTLYRPGLHPDPLEDEEDALASADDEISANITDLMRRPSVLFLTGDQIYADDVADSVFLIAGMLAERLTGWQERIPLAGPEGDEINISRLDRRKLVKDSGFTSDEPKNHLLSFGEYAAMYLLAWNPDLWPDEGMREPFYPESEETDAVLGFKSTLHKVRRVLANTPTYMIFDDHEVSDDWNLDRRWYEQVRKSPTGRRIVANSLAAYWGFQGWGNSPEAFSPRFIEAISEHLNSKQVTGRLADRFDQRIWGFHRWSYYLPSNPPVIVPDSRTQRGYDSDTGAARLLDRYGIEWIRTAWSDLGEPRQEDLILVTSTPVYGFEPLEKGQKILSSFGVPPYKYDRESWIANKEGFSALLLLLADEIRPKRCIIISGDVHYAFTNKARFFSNINTLDVVQLTSSAINNRPKEYKVLRELGRLSDRYEYRLGWQPDAPRTLRLTRPALEFLVRWGLLKSERSAKYYWTDEVESLIPEGENSSLYPYNNIGLVSFKAEGTLEHCLITGFASRRKIRCFIPTMQHV